MRAIDLKALTKSAPPTYTAMANFLSPRTAELGPSSSAIELPQILRVASNDSGESSSSVNLPERDSKSFWDIRTYGGTESMFSLQSADEETWMYTQVCECLVVNPQCGARDAGQNILTS